MSKTISYYFPDSLYGRDLNHNNLREALKQMFSDVMYEKDYKFEIGISPFPTEASDYWPIFTWEDYLFTDQQFLDESLDFAQDRINALTSGEQ